MTTTANASQIATAALAAAASTNTFAMSNIFPLQHHYQLQQHHPLFGAAGIVSPAADAAASISLPLSCAIAPPPAVPTTLSKAVAKCQLSSTEVVALRQMIAGYRESAAFLYRSADELEALLIPKA